MKLEEVMDSIRWSITHFVGMHRSKSPRTYNYPDTIGYEEINNAFIKDEMSSLLNNAQVSNLCTESNKCQALNHLPSTLVCLLLLLLIPD